MVASDLCNDGADVDIFAFPFFLSPFTVPYFTAGFNWGCEFAQFGLFKQGS